MMLKLDLGIVNGQRQVLHYSAYFAQWVDDSELERAMGIRLVN